MRRARGQHRLGRVGQGVAASALCLLLANCIPNTSSRVDPKYGVSSSARVVEYGQPVPKGGGTYRVGRPYTIAGRVYTPEENINYREEGMASWYGDDFHGRYTANGEIFDMDSISAAHPTLPMPSYVRVTNLRNKKSVVVRVNDRGPYANDRIIDLSRRTAQLLGFHGHGVARVRVEYVGRAPLAGSDDSKLMATLREGDRPAQMMAERAPQRPSVKVASAQENFVPEMFDARPMTQLGSKVPAPADRPYDLGQAGRIERAPLEAPRMQAPPVQEASRQIPRGPAYADAMPPRSAPVARAPLDAPAPPAVSSQGGERLTSPVSAYAPVGYAPPAAGFMNGRGLY